MKPVIIIVAYNRPRSLTRLLDSIKEASYPERAKLIISLENGSPKEVVEIANDFECKDLDIEVLQHPKKMGLRNHIIKCGNMSKSYGSAIILEDDLIVDKYFYLYASRALSYYKNDNNIAGISLYSPEYNELNNFPFSPMHNGFDTFLMQIPCSWGQCWTDDQWQNFIDWYDGKSQYDLNLIERLPSGVRDWSESSWKKYFFAYMIDNKKYFIYPYISYTTNCADPGTHEVHGTSLFQVKLGSQLRPIPGIIFAPANEHEVVYDSFMEPIGNFIWRTIGYQENEIEIDIYGYKPLSLIRNKKYALTSKKIAESIFNYKLIFRPIENNLKYPCVHGDSPDFSIAETVYIVSENRIKLSKKNLEYFTQIKLDRRVMRSLVAGIFKSIAARLKK